MLLLRAMYYMPVYYEDDWLESDTTIDPAIHDVQLRVSTRLLSPTQEQKQQPVCVLVHGFSASSFELEAFKASILAKDPTVLFSTIVMGGHGRSYDAFKSASYHDWIQPIIDEVSTLNDQGFQDIRLFGVSAGAAGIVHLILNGELKHTPIRQVVLMDPYILPTNKTLYLVPVLKYVITNTRLEDIRSIGTQNWYTNRPASALHELLKLVKSVQHDLTTYDGKIVPPMTIYTANNDPTADTKGVDMVLDALGSDVVTIKRYDSDRHVIIEPTSKDDWAEKDQAHYDRIIDEIYGLIQLDNR